MDYGESVMDAAFLQLLASISGVRSRRAAYLMLPDELHGTMTCTVQCSSSQGVRPRVSQDLALGQGILEVQGSTAAPL